MTAKKQPPGTCPQCGAAKGFERKVFTKGHYIHRGDWDSNDEIMVDDLEVQYIGSSNVKCVSCGQVSRWPRAKET